MSLGKIYFILVRPQMGENIGSVARAIKNFKIKHLRIVNPRCNWPNQKALATSVGAKDILKSAKIYNSIEKAIGDLDIIFASTSRIRKVNKKIISIFSGSRTSEINVLTPILLRFVKIVKEKYDDIHFIFHTTNEHRETLKNQVSKHDIENCDVISDEKIKSYILKKSMFAVAKSGTISLEICNANVPSIIIYKMNFINICIYRNCYFFIIIIKNIIF